jgi:signal transduction histidine kinase
LAGQITKAVQTIDATVSNMLTFSADIQTQGQHVQMEEVLRDTIHLFAHEQQQKKVALLLELPHEPHWVKGDAHLLKQMVLNLCLNAIKAMKAGGQLLMRLNRRDDYVELLIKDNGCGISPRDLHRIFDPFFTTFPGGTGLGLSVVNQIVEKHEGAIDIQSMPNEGTAVYVTLPVLTEDV